MGETLPRSPRISWTLPISRTARGRGYRAQNTPRTRFNQFVDCLDLLRKFSQGSDDLL